VLENKFKGTLVNKKRAADAVWRGCKKKGHSEFRMAFLAVVTEGIEPPTQGFSVLCSTN
jgi:hypothetical protein